MEPLNDRELSEVLKQLPDSPAPATLESRIFGPLTKSSSGWSRFVTWHSVRIPIPVLTLMVLVFLSLVALAFQEGRNLRLAAGAKADVSLQNVRAEEANPASQNSGNKEGAVPGKNGQAVRLDAQTLGVTPKAADLNLMTSSDPIYPTGAENAGPRGSVRLRIRINTDGHVVDASVISGDPAFVPAAIAAVKERVYRPTLLNGNPIAVVSEAEVSFKLNVTLLTSLVGKNANSPQ